MTTTIWHNPRCSKSRQTLQLLRDNGTQPEVVEYLKTPPSAAELTAVLTALQMTPRELMRTKEAVYKQMALGDDGLSDQQLIDAMVNEPKLIERPVVIHDGKAALGRPPEQVLALF